MWCLMSWVSRTLAQSFLPPRPSSFAVTASRGFIPSTDAASALPWPARLPEVFGLIVSKPINGYVEPLFNSSAEFIYPNILKQYRRPTFCRMEQDSDCSFKYIYGHGANSRGRWDQDRVMKASTLH